MPITVDTRFLLTHFLADTDELKERTSARLAELQKEMAFVPTIVIHEVYKFMFEKLGKEVAQLRIDSILTSRLRTIELTAKIAVMSAALRCQYRNLPTADSIVAATSIQTGSKRVLSDDLHFKKISSIRSEWI
jgi:predicted nucleic acid-binding protein